MPDQVGPPSPCTGVASLGSIVKISRQQPMSTCRWLPVASKRHVACGMPKQTFCGDENLREEI
eukprot:3867810-Ditylum_brightwellii.AAC.1